MTARDVMNPVPVPARLVGLRCPACRGKLDSTAEGFGCENCGESYAHGPHPRVVQVRDTAATFAQGYDAHLLSDVVPALEASVGTPAERVMMDEATRLGFHLGNPVTEGRADIARLLPQAGGIVLDVGCGYGTFTCALARGAEHVFALDQSPVRAALTAVRTATEGLDNVTTLQGDGRTLPLSDGACDLVTVIGVLEWTGVGEPDPVTAHRRLMAEIARVLRPGGTLLLGIENRFGGHYVLGLREEHVGLPFVSLLPRPLGRAATRVFARRRLDVLTHSYASLLRLAREAGLQGKMAYPLPSYHSPQLNVDGADLRSGLRIYTRHVLRLSGPLRRIAGRVAPWAPAWLLRRHLPSFWLVATKGAVPPPVVVNITGTGFADGTMKVVDVHRRVLRRITRTGGISTEEQLLDGLNARAWVQWPLRAAVRARRERQLLSWVAQEGNRDRRPATADEIARGRAEAEAGLVELRDGWAAGRVLPPSSPEDIHSMRVEELPVLRPATADWCAELVAGAWLERLPSVREHGDLVLGNVIVEPGGKMVAVDQPANAQDRRGLVGADVVLLLVDLLSTRRGHSAPDAAVAIDGLGDASDEDSAAIARVLRVLEPELDVEDLERAVVLSVLRHCGTKGDGRRVDRRFLERAADGELRSALLEVVARAG